MRRRAYIRRIQRVASSTLGLASFTRDSYELTPDERAALTEHSDRTVIYASRRLRRAPAYSPERLAS